MGLACLGLEELGLLRHVGAAAQRVHGQPRYPHLLLTRRVGPDHLGDGRSLAQQLEVFDAPRLQRIALGVDPGQGGPAQLVLDVQHILFDAGRRAVGLLVLKRQQVVLVLAVGEIQAERAAGDQHARHQRNDQRRVFRKEAPAADHPRARRAPGGIFGAIMTAMI